ncbi:MAG: hypothetical protein RSB39_06345 [Oscillospiraceae bacterium]
MASSAVKLLTPLRFLFLNIVSIARKRAKNQQVKTSCSIALKSVEKLPKGLQNTDFLPCCKIPLPRIYIIYKNAQKKVDP